MYPIKTLFQELIRLQNELNLEIDQSNKTNHNTKRVLRYTTPRLVDALRSEDTSCDTLDPGRLICKNSFCFLS